MQKRYPVKQDVNLAMKERKHRNLGAVGLTALVLAVAVGLFCKFGVVDRLNKVAQAERGAVSAETLLAQVQAETADYDDVLEEYRSYTLAHSAMSGGADVMECLNLIQTQLMSKAKVGTFTVADSLVSVQLSGVTLQEVSGLYSTLMASELVSGVQVYTAATGESGGARVSAAMTIEMAVPETAEQEAAS